MRRWCSIRGRELGVLLKKEFATTLKERASRMILVAPIILYVILFGYIATFNLDYVPYALLDLSQSKASAEFARRIDASPVFERVRTLSNTAEIASAVEEGKALVVVAVDADFARDLARGSPARVQVIIDGRNSTTAQLAAGYLSVLAQDFTAARGASGLITARFLYNPNNITQWFIMPGLIVMLSMLLDNTNTASGVALWPHQRRARSRVPSGVNSTLLGQSTQRAPPTAPSQSHRGTAAAANHQWMRYPLN